MSAAAAASVPTPAGATDLMSDEEFAKLWLMGLSGERSLGRPKDWDGNDKGFDEFVFKFATWLGSLPGDAEELLTLSQDRVTTITMATLTERQRVVAKAVSLALKTMTGGKALNIVKQVERGNGFEAWRRLWSEYRPNIAGRKVNLLERVMEDKPASGEDFSSWYFSWTEKIRETEEARKKPIDADIKCAVAMRRVPRELRDHLVLESATIADNWELMNDKIVSWMTARRLFSTAPGGSVAKKVDDMDVGAVKGMFGKSDGKYGGKPYYGGKSDGKFGGKFGKSYYGGKSGGKSDSGKFGKSFGGKSDGGKFGKQYNGKGFGKSDGKSGKGKGWDNTAPVPFQGYCGHCWQWGHKKSQCPSRPTHMDVGALQGSS